MKSIVPVTAFLLLGSLCANAWSQGAPQPQLPPRTTATPASSQPPPGTVELMTSPHQGTGCPSGFTTPTAQNSWRPVEGPVRISAGGPVTVEVFGNGFDQITDDPILVNSEGNLSVRLVGSYGRSAAENRSTHCIERGSRTIQFVELPPPQFAQATVTKHELQLRLPGGGLSDVIKIQRHPLPDLRIRLQPAGPLNIPCGDGLSGSLHVSPNTLKMILPRGGVSCNGGGPLAAVQTMTLPPTLGGRKYHFVFGDYQYYGGRGSGAGEMIGSTGDYNYLSDPLGDSPTTIQWGTGIAKFSHEDSMGRTRITTLAGIAGEFESSLDVDETPVFSTGPEFSPRRTLRPGESFQVTFNIGSPNPNGQLITYRLTDAKCFSDAGSSGFDPGKPFSDVKVPARTRRISLNLRVSSDAVSRGCVTTPERPHALEAWAGKADLTVTQNPFYINGPIHIAP